MTLEGAPRLMLRSYREWYRLDQLEAATLLADLGEARERSRPGVTNEMVSRWERGVSRPGHRYRALLCSLYQVGEAHLGFRRPLPGEVVLHPWDGVDGEPPAVAPWTAQGGIRSARAALEGDSMHRRAFLTATAMAVTSPAQDWLIAPPVTAARSATGTVLPPGVVDQLDDITAQLRRMDDQLGGAGGLLPLVRQHLTHAVDLIEHRRYTDTVGRRLHSSAAELARLAGWLSFDAGRHVSAQRYFAAALHAAHVAGDRALGANILGFASCQAKDLGQVTEAVQLAEAAVAGYPGASPRVTAILNLRLAEARANNHEPAGTRRALDAAFDRLTDPAVDGEPDWSYWLDEAQAHAQAGYCYLALGDTTRAQIHLHAALDRQGPSFGREATLRQVLLATAYSRQGQPDLDQAVALGTAAMTRLAGEIASQRCVGHLGQLATDLTPYRTNAVVRDFLDQTRAALTTDAAH